MQKRFGTAIDLPVWLEGNGAKCFHDGCPDGSREHGRDTVPDLAESVPFGPMKAEPVGIGVKSCSLANRNDPGKFGMDGPRRSEAAARTVGSRAESVGLSGPGELEESALGFRLALWRG